MLEAMLELHTSSESAEQLLWSSPMPGVRVCGFSISAGSAFSSPSPVSGNFEVLFCLEGQFDLQLKNQTRLSASPFEILLLSDAAEVHTMQTAPGLLRGILVMVNQASANESLRLFYTMLGGIPLDLMRAKTLLAQYDGCACIRNTPWSAGVFSTLTGLLPEEQNRYCTLRTAELLYLLCSGSPLLPEKPSLRYFDRHQLETIRKVRDYILTHPDEDLTINRLCNQFHISSTLLKECFRSQYGKPVHRFIRDFRMQRAAELLRSTNLPISRIAVMAGYGSSSQFGAAFRCFFRITPSRYRRSLQQ